MDQLFLQIINMSLNAGYAIAFVLFARLILKQAPKIFSYALWSVVLFRLLCPVSVEGLFSFVPLNSRPVPQTIIYEQMPRINSGITAVDQIVNQMLPVSQPSHSVNPLQLWIAAAQVIWISGMGILLLCNLISLIRLKRGLVGAVREHANIYMADGLVSPFVMGIIKPRIYLPSDLCEQEKQYIILHEQTHIKRLDYLVKFISFLLLCIHWFNPLVWAAFIFMAKDMEMSCDERVMKQMDTDIRQDYAASLLCLTAGRTTVSGMPLGYHDGDIKGRIKNILNYKKPAHWVVAFAASMVVIICLGLAGNKKENRTFPEPLSLQAMELTESEANAMFNDCGHLSDEEAKRIFKDIKGLMLSTYTSRGARLEHFSAAFTNEVTAQGRISIEVTVETDWTETRKPEDHPLIIGMRKAIEQLETEEEKEIGRSYMDGFLREMNPEYLKTERIPTYFKAEILPDDDTDAGYELFFTSYEYGLESAAFYEERYKEDPEAKEQLGREMIQDELNSFSS